MWLEAIPVTEGHSDKCPTCRGCVCRRPHGEMHAGSFVYDGQRVEIRRVPAAEYADPIVLDALTQYFDGGLYRLWPGDRYLSRGGKKLHRDAWSAAFGPIQNGCHIHHRDDDPLNNALVNLECMDGSAHLSHTWRNGPRSKFKTGQHFSETARQKAAEWHGSEAGRLWHSRNAKRTKNWTRWKREPRRCPECDAKFDALIRKSGNTQIYCGETCKAAAYRERAKVWSKNYRERQKAK